jgi:hypothetical protein
VIAVHELLEAEKQHGNCNKVSRNRRKHVLAALGPPLGEAGCQRQRTAAEGQFPQRERQPKPISRVLCPSGDVHQHHEKEKRQSEQTRRQTRLNPRHQAERSADKASSYKVRPKLMPRNPRRYDRCDSLCQREMFSAERRQRRCVKERTE